MPYSDIEGRSVKLKTVFQPERAASKMSVSLTSILEHAQRIEPKTLEEAKHQIKLYELIAREAVAAYKEAKGK
jgi:hypothetical protein